MSVGQEGTECVRATTSQAVEAAGFLFNLLEINTINCCSVRVYGIEEATSSWMVTAADEQRIVAEEGVSCEFEQQQPHKKRKEKQNKGKEKVC